MKIKLQPLVVSLCVLGLMSPLFAADNSSNVDQRLTALQNEVNALKKQLGVAHTNRHSYKRSSVDKTPISKPQADLQSQQTMGPGNLPSAGSLEYLPVDVDEQDFGEFETYHLCFANELRQPRDGDVFDHLK